MIVTEGTCVICRLRIGPGASGNMRNEVLFEVKFHDAEGAELWCCPCAAQGLTRLERELRLARADFESLERDMRSVVDSAADHIEAAVAGERNRCLSKIEAMRCAVEMHPESFKPHHVHLLLEALRRALACEPVLEPADPLVRAILAKGND